VTQYRPLGLWNEAHEIQFDLSGGTVFGETEPRCKALHMGIHHDPLWRTKRVTEHHIRRLAPHSRQGRECIHGLRHFPPMPFQKGLRAALEIFRLGPKKSGGLHYRLEFRQGNRRIILSSRAPSKQLASYLVHADVRALSRENRCHQQLQWVRKIEFTVRLGICLGENKKRFWDALGFGWNWHTSACPE